MRKTRRERPSDRGGSRYSEKGGIEFEKERVIAYEVVIKENRES